MAVRLKKVRQIAETLLLQNGSTDAPVDVERIAQNLGLTIYMAPAPESLSGYLAREAKTGRTVIGVNSTQKKRRRRFTIAHELGHYLLHDGIEMHVDQAAGETSAYLINLRGTKASEGTDDEEREANAFAAEILMPASFIERDIQALQPIDLLEDSDAIIDLADKYEVSVQAFGYRLANLHLIK